VQPKAGDAFTDQTTAPNQLWKTDFTYLKVIGWGWFYLLTVLDDFSRYIIAWKLCTTMRADDVTETLQLALEASGIEEAKVAHRPRLLTATPALSCARAVSLTRVVLSAINLTLAKCER
jgi:transposase InsO family protein